MKSPYRELKANIDMTENEEDKPPLYVFDDFFKADFI